MPSLPSVDLTRYRAVLFDCDGTLADTMPLHHQAWRRALAEASAPFDFDWQLFTRRAGMTLERTVEELNREFLTTLDPAGVASRQRSHYRALLPQIRGIPVITELAAALAESHLMAVASGGQRAEVEETLQKLGLRHRFDQVVTATDVAHGKPAPDIFLLAAKRLGCAPAECLVIEDGEQGLLAAQNAGMDALHFVAPSTLTLVPAVA